MVPAALEVKDISHAYGENPVLESVSLSVRVGEIHCLIGPSGCGKTTLLRIIAGLEQPKAGEIFMNGMDSTDSPPHKRNLGYVFQETEALFPTTVWSNIAFPFKWGGKGHKSGKWQTVANQIIQDLRLSDHKNHHVSRLSGGLAQRVALARAIVYKPPLLLLDEPLSSLDNKLKSEFLSLLVDMRKTRDVAILYVTHDDREVRHVADRVTVIDHGIVVQSGDLKELLEKPADRVVLELLNVDRGLEGEATPRHQA